MHPIVTQHPFNSRSFFSNAETKSLGKGIEVWRGLFQSLRPTVGRLFINVDISSGLMYKSGPLIPVCLDFLGVPGNQVGALRENLSPQQRRSLSRFLRGLRVEYGKAGEKRRASIQGLSDRGADQEMFANASGQQMSVAQYFRQTRNMPLQHSGLLCVRVRVIAL